MNSRSIILAIDMIEFASRMPVLAVIGQLARAIPAMISHF